MICAKSILIGQSLVEVKGHESGSAEIQYHSERAKIEHYPGNGKWSPLAALVVCSGSIERWH